MELDRGMKTGFGPIGRLLIVAGAFVVVVAGMRAAAVLLTPFLLASFITVIAAGPVVFMKRRGVPKWLALIIASVLMITVGGLIVILVSDSVGTFTENLPEYEDRLGDLSIQGVNWLNGFGLELSPAALTTYLDARRVMQVVGFLLSNLADALTNAVMILTMALVIVLDSNAETRPLAILLGPDMPEIEELVDERHPH
jgi:AI-2 transport protein TqsA